MPLEAVLPPESFAGEHVERRAEHAGRKRAGRIVAILGEDWRDAC
jgi:hypothetical protein